MALAAYTTEYGDVQQLTGIQLDLAGKVIKVLGCIEITKSVSIETSLMLQRLEEVQAIVWLILLAVQNDACFFSTRGKSWHGEKVSEVLFGHCLISVPLVSPNTHTPDFSNFIEAVPYAFTLSWSLWSTWCNTILICVYFKQLRVNYF